uniref:Uncharacterized protein n=1 Tax=Cacopsylla melanoneura TaxID=428564 RepID=A0A8D8XCV6_9HEMI
MKSLCQRLQERSASSCSSGYTKYDLFKGLIESLLKLFILLNYLYLMYFVFSLIYNWLRRYMCRPKTCKPPVNFVPPPIRCIEPVRRHSLRSIGCQPSIKSFTDLICNPRKKCKRPSSAPKRESPRHADSCKKLLRPTFPITCPKPSDHSRSSTSLCHHMPGAKLMEVVKRKLAAILVCGGDDESRSNGRPRSRSQGREGILKNALCPKNAQNGSSRPHSRRREKKTNLCKSSSSFENIRVEFNLKEKGRKGGGMKKNPSCTKCGKCLRGKR